jgi:hypothetical protein
MVLEQPGRVVAEPVAQFAIRHQVAIELMIGNPRDISGRRLKAERYVLHGMISARPSS